MQVSAFVSHSHLLITATVSSSSGFYIPKRNMALQPSLRLKPVLPMPEFQAQKTPPGRGLMVKGGYAVFPLTVTPPCHDSLAGSWVWAFVLVPAPTYVLNFASLYRLVISVWRPVPSSLYGLAPLQSRGRWGQPSARAQAP